MSRKHRSQVLVAGAGPVGLFAAAELARREIDVHIIDQDWRGAGFSYALGLHPASMTLFDELGLADTLLHYGHRVDAIAFYESDAHRFDVDLSAIGGRTPYLTVIPQNWIESVLEEWLDESKVPVHWNHRLKDWGAAVPPVEARIERLGIDYSGYSVPRKIRVVEKTFPFEADFVIGADGHNSRVRKLIGATYETVAPSDLYVVFEFTTDANLGNRAAIVLDRKTTSVLWPLPDGRCRWGFQLADPDEFEGTRVKSRLSEIGHWVSPALTETRLQSLLRERAPWFQGSITDLVWSIPIRFERKLASTFVEGPFCLVGDSGHLAGPLGIQSMNVGFREARDVAQILEDILVQDAPRNRLLAYGQERQEEWAQLLNPAESLEVTGKASDFVRDNAARILPCLPASGSDLNVLLDQLGLRLKRSMPVSQD